MTSTSPWKVEVTRRFVDEDMDWFTGNPGPEMRGRIGSWFKPGVGGPDWTAWLRVVRLATGEMKEAKISKDGRRYTARFQGQDLTLEEATKKMKEELRTR